MEQFVLGFFQEQLSKVRHGLMVLIPGCLSLAVVEMSIFLPDTLDLVSV